MTNADPRSDEAAIDETEPLYSVAETAERTGLSAHTLRYYERAGLMLPVERVGEGAHRRYSQKDLRFLQFLKRLRATGMPISEMQNYVTLVREGDRTHEARRELLELHACRVRARIEELKQNLAGVEWKIDNYRRLSLEEPAEAGHGPCDDPVLSAAELGKGKIK